MTSDTETRVLEALTSIAEGDGLPDHDAGLAAVRARIAAGERRRRRLAWIGGAGLAAAAAAAGLLVVVGGDEPPESVDVRPQPPATAPPDTAPTTLPTGPIAAVPDEPLVFVTPDGRQLALADASTGELAGVLVTAGEGELIEDPSIAPDGRVLYTVAGDDDRIGAVLLDGSVSAAALGFDAHGTAPTMNAAGVLAFADGEAIELVDIATARGRRIELGAPADELAFSPSGDALAYLRGGALEVVPVEGTDVGEAQIVPGRYDALVWATEGHLQALGADGAVAVDLGTGEVAPVPDAPAGAVDLAAGTSVTYLLDDGTVHPLGIEASAIAMSAPAQPDGPVYEPPANPLAVGTETGLAVVDLDTGEVVFGPIQVGVAVYETTIGPDGSVWFTAELGDTEAVAVLRPGEPVPEQPFGAGTAAPALAPDGRTLAFVRDRTTLVVTDLETGDVLLEGPWDGTRLGSLDWSPDGSRLLFLVDGILPFVLDGSASSLDEADGLPVTADDARLGPGGDILLRSNGELSWYGGSPSLLPGVVAVDADVRADGTLVALTDLGEIVVVAPDGERRTLDVDEALDVGL